MKPDEVATAERADLIEYLSKHFRYSTMNSWNRSSSYARNVKVSRLSVSGDLLDKCYALLECEGLYDVINEPLHAFDRAHKGSWSTGYNGRSGGYVVLYRCGRDDKGRECYYPGRDVDQGEDFASWEDDDLRARALIVAEFDAAVDEMIALFLDVARRARFVEDTVVRCVREKRFLLDPEEPVPPAVTTLVLCVEHDANIDGDDVNDALSTLIDTATGTPGVLDALGPSVHVCDPYHLDTVVRR